MHDPVDGYIPCGCPIETRSRVDFAHVWIAVIYAQWSAAVLCHATSGAHPSSARCAALCTAPLQPAPTTLPNPSARSPPQYQPHSCSYTALETAGGPAAACRRSCRRRMRRRRRHSSSRAALTAATSSLTAAMLCSFSPSVTIRSLRWSQERRWPGVRGRGRGLGGARWWHDVGRAGRGWGRLQWVACAGTPRRARPEPSAAHTHPAPHTRPAPPAITRPRRPLP